MRKRLLSMLLCISMTVIPVLTTGCDKDDPMDLGNTQQTNDSDINVSDTEGEETTEAKDEDKSSKGLEFTMSADKSSYILVGIGTCSDKDIIVPSTYEGLPVASVGNNAFKDNKTVESIALPESVTAIGDNAFGECTLLVEIVLGSKVTSIGNGAFKGCVALNNVKLPATLEVMGTAVFKDCAALTSITIPEKITTVSEDTFSGCVKLLTVILHNAIVCIENGAFEGCVALAEIQLPASIKTIGENVFKSCKTLVKVFLPERLETVGKEAFADCDALKEVIVQSKNIPNGLDFAIDEEKVEVKVEHKEHTLKNVDAKQPDCTEKGWKAYQYCTVCDYTTLEYIDANGHNYGAWIEQVDAECDKTGTLGHYH